MRINRCQRIANRTLILALGVLLVCTIAGKADNSYGAPPPNLTTHLDRLVRSYPDWIAGYDEKYLILGRGERFAVSDGRKNKSFEEMLEKPDIDDMFFAAYPAGSTPQQPALNSDPGRVRFEPLFVSMYGDCKENQVLKNLRTIPWLPKYDGGRVTITSINGIDKALDAVSRELEELPPPLIKYLKPTAGTYNCRVVAGTQIRSMHAYGAALEPFLTTGVGTRRVAASRFGKTEFQLKLFASLRDMGLSGVATGITTIQCISNIGRSYCRSFPTSEPVRKSSTHGGSYEQQACYRLSSLWGDCFGLVRYGTATGG
jgi:hypothetical protein